MGSGHRVEDGTAHTTAMHTNQSLVDVVTEPGVLGEEKEDDDQDVALEGLERSGVVELLQQWDNLDVRGGKKHPEDHALTFF